MRLTKIFALIAFVALASGASAQKNFYKFFNTGSLKVTVDTVTNTGTNTLVYQSSAVANYTVIQAIVTKQSGTPAGRVKLYGSLDGTNWALAQSTYFYVKNVSGAQDTAWVISGNPFPWYQLSYTGVGTMACTLQGLIYHK